MSKCCNGDCDQGRNCPHRQSVMSIGDVAFTVVMLLITVILAVSVMWWAITLVASVVEAIK